VSGPGINPKYIRANTPITFKVDASKSAKGKVDVKMEIDKGKKAWIVYLFKRIMLNIVLNGHWEYDV